MSPRTEDQVETLEGGHCFFIYRPRVGEEEPGGAEDIQRLYMVLRPRGRKVYRLLTIGRKKLPEPQKAGRGRFWAFVDTVSEHAKEIEHAFDPERYQTKTRGERKLPAGRPAGEGVYRIVRHGDHAHLVYALELPRQPGEAQQELNIEPEASYIISVKNPQRGQPQAVGLSEDQQAAFPKKLQDIFRDRRFVPADPPEFLDYPGAEVLLIAADEDVRAELGIELDPKRETERTAEIFTDLRMERSEHPVKPLLTGEWD